MVISPGSSSSTEMECITGGHAPYGVLEPKYNKVNIIGVK